MRRFCLRATSTPSLLFSTARFASAPAAAAPAAAATTPNPGSALSDRAPAELKGSQAPALLDQLVGYYVNVQSRKMYYKDFLRIEHQAVRWAFADIRKNSEALAHGLLSTGVRPGMRVLAVQPSNCESLVMQLACAKIGALLCVVSPNGMTADKLRYYLNEFQPHHFIGREWIVVPEAKPNSGGSGEMVERNVHFFDLIYNVIPELGLSYPGQKFNWVHSQEFYFLKRVVVTDHNVNLLGVTPLRRMLIWGPFSYYEQRLRRLSALLHPDDPILTLEDASPVAEDKRHVAFSHRNCANAGFIFANMLGLRAETRFAVFPNHHVNPIGAIVAPYAALTSGAVLVQLHDNLFTDEHVLAAIEKLCVEEVAGILGTKRDFDALLKHAGSFEPDQYEHLKWVAIFEDSGAADAAAAVTPEYMKQLAAALGLDDVFVFSGPLETSFMLQVRSLKNGGGAAAAMVPHAEAKVVGDRGGADARTLSKNTRGNLKLRGPHVSAAFYNNAGLLSEHVDEKGFVSTSREGVIDEKGLLSLHGAQIY